MLVRRRYRKHRWLRNPLPKPLMGSDLITVEGIVLEKKEDAMNCAPIDCSIEGGAWWRPGAIAQPGAGGHRAILRGGEW